MKTLNQALIWIDQQNTKALDMDGRFGAQCVDLIWFYQRFLAIPITWVKAAREFWDKDWQDCRKTDKPERGAVVVWNDKVGKGYGHAAIVTAVFGDGSFQSLDQNYYNFNLERGAPAAYVRHNMDKVAGFIVPNFTADPAPQPAPAEQPAAQPGRYKIRKNDTFWEMENRYGWPHGTLQNMNPGVDPRKLQIGQIVIVPTGPQEQAPPAPRPTVAQYTIVKDDTFWELETKNGWPHGTLQKLNPGVDPRRLQIGQKINRPA